MWRIGKNIHSTHFFIKFHKNSKIPTVNIRWLVFFYAKLGDEHRYGIYLQKKNQQVKKNVFRAMDVDTIQKLYGKE